MPLPTNITDAAARLVAQHGPDGFTMDDLAQAVGLSRATLYRQAGSREAVLAELASRGMAVGKRVETRDRILTACRVVFTRAGFEAATLEDVAREAGVGPATVYRQFGDKSGLIRSFAEQLGPQRALQEVAVTPTGDLRADLECVVATALRFASEDIDLLKLAMLEQMRGGPWGKVIRDSPLRGQALLIRLLESYTANGALGPIDPLRMSQILAGMLLAFLMGPMMGDDPLPDPEETASFIVHVFLDGLMSAEQKTR